jgi:hypothetical protein
MNAAKSGSPGFRFAQSGLATPNFFCRLVDEVVYWKTSRLPELESVATKRGI